MKSGQLVPSTGPLVFNPTPEEREAFDKVRTATVAHLLLGEATAVLVEDIDMLASKGEGFPSGLDKFMFLKMCTLAWPDTDEEREQFGAMIDNGVLETLPVHVREFFKYLFEDVLMLEPGT